MNKRLVYLILFLASAWVLSSCKEDTLDMTVLTKTMFEDAVVDEINATAGWNVTVVQDSRKTGVELEYSAFLEDYLRIQKDGSALHVGFSQRLILPTATVKNVTVYVSSLRQLTLTEAATADLQGSCSGTSLSVDLDKGAIMRGGQFSGDLQMKLNHASTVADFVFDGASANLRLENASVFKGVLTTSDLLEIYISEASRMTTYSGSSPEANVTMNDASFLNMTQTEIAEMHLSLQSASEASVMVTSTLEAYLRDASKLYYLGNPIKNIDADDSSSCCPL